MQMLPASVWNARPLRAGRCAQAGILTNAPGPVQKMLLMGVLAKSVGIRLASGAMYVVWLCTLWP